VKVLVTGGAGFVGRWLLKSLPEDAAVVVVDSLDERVHDPEAGFPPAVASRATCVRADVRDTHLFAEAAEGTDVVVHLASQTDTAQSRVEMSHFVQHNVEGTARLLEMLASLRRLPARIILSSSRAVYGEGCLGDDQPRPAPQRSASRLGTGAWEVQDAQGKEVLPLPMREDHPLRPTSVYGLTKHWQEQLVETWARGNGVDFLIVRFQNVYGPGQSLRNPNIGVLGQFVDAILRDREIELCEDGNMTRDFVYASDAARFLVQGALHAGPLGVVLNCGSGESITLRDLVRRIEVVTGRTARVRCTSRYRPGDVRHAVADMSSYSRYFGPWRPTPLEAGLREYLLAWKGFVVGRDEG
jgi:dTDP-L-rhamnose 4-epimerase